MLTSENIVNVNLRDIGIGKWFNVHSCGDYASRLLMVERLEKMIVIKSNANDFFYSVKRIILKKLSLSNYLMVSFT